MTKNELVQENYAQRQEIERLRELVRDLAYTDPCRLDAHGYCQAHAWLSETKCPHARASEALAGTKEADEAR